MSGLNSRILSCGLILVVTSAAMTAKAGSWSATGPDGGQVYAVSFDPSRPERVYAGTSSGVYRSVDGGMTWIFSGLAGFTIENIAVASAPSDAVYASSGPRNQSMSGVFRSTDAGITWVSASSGLEYSGVGGVVYREIADLLVDTVSPEVVWAAAQHMGTASDLGGGLYRSVDGGRNWYHAAFELRDGYALAIDPNDPAQMWASIRDPGSFSPSPRGGVFKSIDHGETWAPAHQGLLRTGPAISRYLAVRAFEISESDSNVVYGLATEEAVRTLDGGELWEVVSAPLPQSTSFTAFSVDYRTVESLWLTTWPRGGRQTHDGGETWQFIGEGLGCTPSAIDLSPFPDRRLLVGSSYDGVFSTDAADTTEWSRSQSGLQAHQVSGLVADPVEPNRLLVTTQAPGIFLSPDDGSTWTLNNPESFPNCPSNNPDTFDCSVFYHLVVASESPTFYATGWCGVFRSKDHGASWEYILTSGGPLYPLYRGITIDPTDNMKLYTSRGSAVSSSEDGGDTWVSCAEIDGLSPLAMSVGGSTSSVVLAGTGEGVFRSFDHCETWVAAGLEDRRVFMLSTHPELLETIFAGTEDGLYVSRDSGATWDFLGLEGYSITSVVVEARWPGRLFAGAYTGGVFSSRDNGETWSQLVVGLDNLAVTALALRGDGQVLFAGTAGNGVYEFRIHPVDGLLGPDRPEE